MTLLGRLIEWLRRRKPPLDKRARSFANRASEAMGNSTSTRSMSLSGSLATPAATRRDLARSRRAHGASVRALAEWTAKAHQLGQKLGQGRCP